MFARLLTEQMEANKSYPASFSDVTSAHWAANYIGYMEQFGIVRGYSNGTFRPNAPITRAEFAAICCRFEQLTDGAELRPSRMFLPLIGRQSPSPMRRLAVGSQAMQMEHSSRATTLQEQRSPLSPAACSNAVLTKSISVPI